MKHDFMSHDLHLPELTLRGMLLGALITLIFTASNVYLTWYKRKHLQLVPYLQLFLSCQVF